MNNYDVVLFVCLDSVSCYGLIYSRHFLVFFCLMIIAPVGVVMSNVVLFFYSIILASNWATSSCVLVDGIPTVFFDLFSHCCSVFQVNYQMLDFHLISPETSALERLPSLPKRHRLQASWEFQFCQKCIDQFLSSRLTEPREGANLKNLQSIFKFWHQVILLFIICLLTLHLLSWYLLVISSSAMS